MTRNLTQLAVPAGVVGIVLLLVVPLPAAMLDVLIVTNIALSLVVLLTSRGLAGNDQRGLRCRACLRGGRCGDGAAGWQYGHGRWPDPDE